jgi:four helix bundle protein
MSASYRDLRVWQTSMRLVANIYTATQDFPKSELYGLVNQMRRAAVSVPSNIAEGKGRLTDRDRAHFFSQARGFLLELETQILIGEQLKYISSAQANALVQLSAEVGRMLNGLIDSIRPKHATSAP